MRKCEQQIIKLLLESKTGTVGRHDTVDRNNGALVARLWGSVYVRLSSSGTIELGIDGGRFQTETTKSRINAIAQAFHLPGICQRKYVWYWSDGIGYSGVRTFIIESKGDRT